MAGFLVLLVVAVITWSLFTLLGPAFLGGREAFLDWRETHVTTYYLLYAAVVVLVLIPALVVVGRHLQHFEDEREEAALSARGVGRLAMRALRKDKAAIEKLESLLDDENRAVRCQAARALSLLDDSDATRTLLRKVRYWPGDDKLALIDVLKRTRDLRCVPLMQQLAADRNPMIAGKARTAMPQVQARAASMAELENEARKRSAAHERRNRAARERAARHARTTAPDADEGAPEASESEAPGSGAPGSGASESASADSPTA